MENGIKRFRIEWEMPALYGKDGQRFTHVVCHVDERRAFLCLQDSVFREHHWILHQEWVISVTQELSATDAEAGDIREIPSP